MDRSRNFNWIWKAICLAALLLILLAIPVTPVQSQNSNSGPWALLDRSEATRFSAIQLTGGGFTPGAMLRIMIGDTVFSRITATPGKGAIPDNTWIWVPDEIPFGPTKV
jgi:hypothetical protein